MVDTSATTGQESSNKPVPSIVDVFRTGVAEIFTHQPFQAYPAAAIARKGAAKDGGEWMQETGQKEGELIVSYQRSKQNGTTFVQFRQEIKDGAQRETALANLWRKTTELSDLDSDVYLAMVAQLLKGEKDEHGNTWITAQQILNYRGIQPKTKEERGTTYTSGHRWEGGGNSIEAVSDCIRRMENVFIKIQEMEIIDDTATNGKKHSRPKRTYSHMSRLFMFGDTIVHNTLPIGGPSRSYTIAWQYRESTWMLPFLKGPNRFVGMLFQKVLNYDPYHEKWEKRLSKHLMFWLRTNASREKRPDLIIGNLLSELNLEIDERFPQRTRERFEKAMNRIAEDELLLWRYKGEVVLPARKWLPTWLQIQIVIDDVPTMKNQYAVIASTAKAVATQKQSRRGRKAQANKE